MTFACGSGLLNTFPYSIPGNFKSAPNTQRPVTLSTPSILGIDLPTILSVSISPPKGTGLRRDTISAIVHRSLGYAQDGLYDLLVTGAAAKISGDGNPHLPLRRVRIFVEESFSTKDHAGSAITALDCPMLDECLLNGM
jgi:hypothetical protein